MLIEGLIPFKSFIDQAIASLYFSRISNNLCSSSSVNAANIIIGLDVPASKRHASNLQAILLELNPLRLCSLMKPSLHKCLIFLHYFH